MPTTLTRTNGILKDIDAVVAPLSARGLVSHEEMAASFKTIGDLVDDTIGLEAAGVVKDHIADVRDRFAGRETVSHGEFFDAFLDLRKLVSAAS